MRQRDETKAQQILAATLDEVRDVGLAGLSVEAVARRAGVATGTVYIYFKNKEALLEALYLHTKTRFSEMVLRDEGLPLRAAFSNMTRAYLDYVLKNEAEIVFMAQMANSPYVTAKTRQTAALGAKSLLDLLERGKAEHLLKDMETAWMMTFLNGVLRDMAPIAKPMTAAERSRFQERVATLCWDALKA